MKNSFVIRTKGFIAVSFLTLAALTNIAQRALAVDPPVDPATHAAHLAAGTHPKDATNGDPALEQQLAELRAKLTQFETALAKSSPRPPAPMVPGKGTMPGMSAPAPKPMAGMGSAAPGTMNSGGGMGGMNMMGMMDKMMGMMDKMMSMGGGAMQPGAPMSGGGMGMMDMDMMKMGGMPAGTPAAGMSGGGGMGMDKMEMAGMMGMGAMGNGMSMPSALPGFPGASHLYHIGATDFFLDHPQHIALTTEQQAGLNKAKEQALLAKSASDRAIQQAEQELWTLTAADQPDASKIQAKITEIGKLTGDARLAFIRAVGDASKILTDEQRKILTGFAPPAPAAAPMAGMKDM